MNKVIRILRSLLAVFAGLIIISFFTEIIEFSIVAILNGSVTSDQDIYFEIRNRGPIIFLKFVYTSVAGFLGGYITAWITDRWEMEHGIALAMIQTLSLIWGMSVSPYAQTTPFWVWCILILLLNPAILIGAKLKKSWKDKNHNNVPI